MIIAKRFGRIILDGSDDTFHVLNHCASYVKPSAAKCTTTVYRSGREFYESNRKSILLAVYVLGLLFAGTWAINWLLDNTFSAMVFSDPSWFATKLYNEYIGEPVGGFFGMVLSALAIFKGMQDCKKSSLSFSAGAFVLFGITIFVWPLTGLCMFVVYYSTKESLRILLT